MIKYKNCYNKFQASSHSLEEVVLRQQPKGFFMNNDYSDTTIVPDEVIIKKGRSSYSITAFGLFTFGIVSTLAQIICQIILILLIKKYPSLKTEEWINYIEILIPMYVIAFPTSFLVFRLSPKNPPKSEKMSFSKLLSFFVMMIPLTLILNMLSILLADFLSDGSATNPINDIITDVNIWQISTVVILAPIVEETLFRKFIIDRTRAYGEKLSIFFSALCFGLFHMNIFQIFYAFALGFILAYIYIRTGRIRYTIILHMIFNFWGSVVPLKVSSLMSDSLLNAIESGDSNLLFDTLTNDQIIGVIIYFLYIFIEIGLFVAGIIMWICFIAGKKAQFMPAQMELPAKKRFRTAFVTLGFLFFFALCAYGTVTNFLM